MADKKGIPAWQRSSTDGSTQAATQEHDASLSATERVRKFLQDPAVKDAPADKKKAFLLSKSVSEDMIHQVMSSDAPTTTSATDGSDQAARQEFDASKKTAQGPSYVSSTDGSKQAAQQEYDASKKTAQGLSYVSPTDGSKEAAQQEFDASKKTAQGSSYVKTTDGSKEAAQQEFDASKRLPGTSGTDGSDEAAKQEFDASKKTPQSPSYVKTTDGSQEAAKQEFDASKAVSFNPQEFRPTPSTPPAPQVRRDVPPIVTYPEFLVQPQKPPPLVTVNRLVHTAYIAGALTASIYALSKYIIAPMSENLNEARHDLLEHSNNHVHEFNEKLSTLVSTIPKSAKSTLAIPDLVDFDAESDVSDPTELFHRDVGTQTSPSLSRRPSVSSSELDTEKPEAMATKHAARLRIIESHLAELLSATENNGTTNQTLQTGIGEARHFVDNLYYSPPGYQYNAGDSAFSSPSASKDKTDAVASLKAEIRGVKGVLLSAKRFPTAGKAGA